MYSTKFDCSGQTDAKRKAATTGRTLFSSRRKVEGRNSQPLKESEKAIPLKPLSFLEHYSSGTVIFQQGQGQATIQRYANIRIIWDGGEGIRSIPPKHKDVIGFLRNLTLLNLSLLANMLLPYVTF